MQEGTVEDAVAVESKPWYLSRTVLVGLGELVGGVADLVAGSPVLGAPVASVALAVSGAAKVFLRVITFLPLRLRRR